MGTSLMTRMVSDEENPVMTALCAINPETLADLDEKIAEAEKFLAKLKVFRNAVTPLIDDSVEPPASRRGRPRKVVQDTPEPAVVQVVVPPDPLPAVRVPDVEDETEDEPETEDQPAPRIALKRTDPEFDTKLVQVRRQVAEFVFKKGLVSGREIMVAIKVAGPMIREITNHPWFERHMDKWRLTAAGKNEGLEGY